MTAARPLEEVRGEALCELLERIPTSNLPESGGLCTVLVTIPVHAVHQHGGWHKLHMTESARPGTLQIAYSHMAIIS